MEKKGNFSRANVIKSDVDISAISFEVLKRFHQLDTPNEGYADAQKINKDPELYAILRSSDDSLIGRLTLKDLAHYCQPKTVFNTLFFGY